MDEPTEIVEEYEHSCRIVREEREHEDLYHYDGPMGHVKTFRNPDKARLYADVQTVTDGFREEKTGERGVPPTVARNSVNDHCQRRRRTGRVDVPQNGPAVSVRRRRDSAGQSGPRIVEKRAIAPIPQQHRTSKLSPAR